MLEIRHDLRDARAMIEKPGNRDERKKYRKAAEIILLKALNSDSGNDEAKALLQHARAVTDSNDVTPLVLRAAPAVSASQPKKEDEIPFTAGPPIFERKEEKKRTKLPVTLFGVLVLTG